MAAFFHWARVGRVAPRMRSTANSNTPAIAKRIAASMKGG